MINRPPISTSSRIALAVEYIHQNACRGIQAHQVAKESGFDSERVFNKYYKAATGCTPGEAILRRQIEEAKKLLVETEFSMAYIAGSCGFSSQRLFDRVFGASEGTPPALFRRKAASHGSALRRWLPA